MSNSVSNRSAPAVARSAPSPSNGIPGLRGTDHIGFTVPDMDQAIDFFVNVIGCEPFFELGPLQSDGDWMKVHLNVHPAAIARRVKFMRCGFGSNFEIFEYSAPGQNRVQPLNSDIGGHHLAFYVDDIHAAIAWLRSRGIEVLGEPTVRTSGPNGGQTWVYFLAPWGMQFELVSFPNGKDYERDTDRRLWQTTRPAE
ncbi:MAG TPA: VOC family protein [Rubrivivax sp.]|nr:VOC family protein [Rubrivivax sp.]